jgi:yecA family protein
MTRRSRKTADPAKTTMADYAMSFDQLGVWMSARAKSTRLRHPQATSLSMLDGAVAAVVAGPVSMHPEEWVCPLLGVAPDAFNHDTKTFSAIAATLMRHNDISETLSTEPERFEPLYLRNEDGEIDPRPWCMGFYAVMNLRPLVWSRLINPNGNKHKLVRPILIHCVDSAGLPLLGAQPRDKRETSFALDPVREIPAAVEALRQFWMPIRFAPGT